MADLNPGYNKMAQDELMANQGAKVYYNAENKRASTIDKNHASAANVKQIADQGVEDNENARAKSASRTVKPAAKPATPAV